MESVNGKRVHVYLAACELDMKKEESVTDISCITEEFEPVCLDVWVLQTTYSNY